MMNVRVLGDRAEIWPEITKAASKARRADVAVAYFGKGGASRLPLRKGSCLVVNLSLATLRSGATSPDELMKLQRKGVLIYKHEHLHAKIYVFPRRAFIGSANNSESSAKSLVEAVVETTDVEMIRHARALVRQFCESTPLGPNELKELRKEYRPPKRGPGGSRNSKSSVWVSGFSRFQLTGSESNEIGAIQQKVSEGRTARQESHYVDVTVCSRPHRYQKDDTIIWIDGTEEEPLVMPPSRVYKTRRWANGSGARFWLLFTEHPYASRCSLWRLNKALGWEEDSPLSRGGRMKKVDADRLTGWWNERLRSKARKK